MILKASSDRSSGFHHFNMSFDSETAGLTHQFYLRWRLGWLSVENNPLYLYQEIFLLEVLRIAFPW